MNRMTTRLLTAGLATLVGAHAHADPPETALRFGMSTALTGPAAELGRNMRTGVLAAFAEANRNDVFTGRVLELISLDDGYEPARTIVCMRELIDEHHVLGIVGNVGTPTAIAALPVAAISGTPFIGAYTGAGVLRRSPPDRFVVNYRASYAQETAAMVTALIDYAGIKPEEIAFFTQRDGYGDAGYAGGLAALREHGLPAEVRVSHGRYERNTTVVEDGLAEVLSADPPARAVIMVGAYAPCAEFIVMAQEFELDAIFLNVSFVGAAPLARGLGEHGDGVIITQVVPHFDAELPIVREYREAMRCHDPNCPPTFGSLEGYVVGRLVTRALADVPGQVDHDSIIAAFEAMGDFDFGLGTSLSLGGLDHQASSNVWPTIIRDGRVVPFDWSDLGDAAERPSAIVEASEERP